MFNGSALVDIGISMTLQDHFSNPAANAMRGWSSMLSRISTYSSGMRSAYETSLNTASNILRGYYSAFEYSAGVQKNAFLTNKMINDGIDHQQEFLRQAQDINIRNPLTAADITSGQKFMAMAGLTAEQIKSAAEPAAQMAAIFDMPMGGKGGTADLLTNIMSTFQVAPDQAQQVSDILAVGTTSANMSLQDLAQSIKYAGANAKMSGLDIKDLTTAVGVLGNYGIQGSMAGTNLGQALNQMNKAITGSSQKGVNALKALGLDPKDLQDAKGNLIPIQQILQKITTGLQGKGGVEKQGILFELFGQRGLRAMMPLLEDAAKGAGSAWNNIMGKLNNSSGWLETTTKEYMESPAGKIDAMKSAWENFIVSFGAGMSTVITPALTLATNIINFISKQLMNNSWLGKFIKWGAILVGVRVTVLAIANGGKLFAFTLKAVSTNLLMSQGASKGLAGGMSAANASAGSMELHMRNILKLIIAQQMAAGRKVTLFNSKGGMTTLYTDKRGRLRNYSTGGIGEVNRNNLNTLVYGMPLQTKTGATGRGAGQGIQRTTPPLARGVAKIFNRVGWSNRSALGIGTKIAGGVAKLGGGLNRIMGFMLGPWGFFISMAVTFLPMIWDAIKGKDDNSKQLDDEMDARQSKRDREIIDAINNGNATRISIDVNGQDAGTYGAGSNVNMGVDGNGDLRLYGL